MPVYLSPPPGGPLARLAAALIGAVLLVGAFFLGFAVLLVALGLSAVAALWVGFKRWQLNRQQPTEPAREKQSARPSASRPSQGDALDGEYQVISRDEAP
jgi:hypothetical protein